MKPPSVPKLGLNKIPSLDVIHSGQKSARDSARSQRNFEHLDKITQTDLASSSRLKLGLTIAYMMETSEFYVVEQLEGKIQTVRKVLDKKMLETLSTVIKVKPNVLQDAVEQLKIDQALQGEIGPWTYGVLNYLDKHCQTSQIWEVEHPEMLLQDPEVRDVESECYKVQKATPRGQRLI